LEPDEDPAVDVLPGDEEEEDMTVAVVVSSDSLSVKSIVQVLEVYDWSRVDL
jgi:hypothetical protein